MSEEDEGEVADFFKKIFYIFQDPSARPFLKMCLRNQNTPLQLKSRIESH